MDIGCIKGNTVTEKWIRCESKSRPGNFYMFNSATGETKRCPNEKQKSNPVIERNLSLARLTERTLPLKLPKSICTPAQDRLKRLQHILKKETKERKVNVESKSEISKPKPHRNIEIPNRYTNVDLYRKVPSEESKDRAIKINRHADILNYTKQRDKTDEDIKMREYKVTASDQKFSSARERIESTELPNVLNIEDNVPSKASCSAAPKRQSSSTSNECSSTKITKITVGEIANRQSLNCVDSPADRGDSFGNTLQNLRIPKLGLGIMDKIKSICRKTFGITSKPSTTSKNRKSQIADIKKLKKHTDLVLDANKYVKGSIDFKKENESDKREKRVLILPQSSSLFQQECKISGLPTSATSIPSLSRDLSIPTYRPGSANSRLDCLRQHLRELSNEISIVTNKTLTASRVPGCSSSTRKDANGLNATFSSNAKDLEPMDWQPIDCEAPESITKEEKEATNGNPKNNEVSSISNPSSSKNTSPISEYYEIVNENLLRFSADQAKGLSNLRHNWMKDYFYIVLDTNVLLENLTFIDDLTEMKLCGTAGTIIYVPYIVLQELDKLKMRSSSESTKALASRAIRFLNGKFEERNLRIQAQSAFDDRKHVIDITSPDDSILNCCLQVKNNINNVLLLSEDVNLRNKAMCNNLLASTKSYLTSCHPSSPTLSLSTPSPSTTQTLSSANHAQFNTCGNETEVVK